MPHLTRSYAASIGSTGPLAAGGEPHAAAGRAPCFAPPSTAGTFWWLSLLLAVPAATAQPVPPADAPATTLPAISVNAGAVDESATGPVGGYEARRSATATKTDTPIVETPQSLSVVSSERMQALGATRIKDALAYTPGINVSPYGHDSRYDWVTIRGFDAYSPGFYMDGLQMRNNNGWAVWQIESYAVERLEVMRGPSSVLYGQGIPGGVVNVVSKRPSAEPLRELQLQLGDASRKEFAGDFGGPLDSDGHWRYRLTGLVRDAKIQHTDLPDDRAFLAPSLTWQPSADTTLTLLSQFLRVRAGANWSGVPVAGSLTANPNGRISPSTFLGEPDFERFHQNQWMLGYLLEHRLNDTWTLRQGARFGKLDLNFRQTSSDSFVTVNAADPSDPANFRLVNRYASSSVEHATAFTLDNQAQGRWRLGDWQHTVLFGLDYQRNRFDQVSGSGTADPIDVYAPVYGGEVDASEIWADAKTRLVQTGVYVQEQAKLGEHWVFVVGGRHDRATSDTDDRLSGGTTRQTDSKFSGRAGVVYLAPGGWAPYIGYAESFAPTATVNPLTGRPFGPETGRQVEAGLRYQPSGGGSYSAALFDLRRRNYITYDANFEPRQTGETRIRGLELEAVFEPLRGLNATLSYAYTPDADTIASSSASEVGARLDSVAKHQASVWADYRFGFGLKGGLGLRYTGATHSTADGSNLRLPSFTLVDAMLGYDFDRWSLALNAHNLGDKVYVSTCGSTSCYYGESRRVTATATYRW